jgi:hypothetical protein
MVVRLHGANGSASVSAPVLKRLTISFSHEGISYAVAYEHSEAHEPANPGTRSRTTSAARMASAGLRRALDALDQGTPVWTGFGTNTRQSTDRIVIERGEEHAA